MPSVEQCRGLSGPYSLAVVASTAGGVADKFELLLEGVAPANGWPE